VNYELGKEFWLQTFARKIDTMSVIYAKDEEINGSSLILIICEFIVGQGIILRTPLQWPQYKGFTFSCWLRVESFPGCGIMGLFAFLSESWRGCFSLLAKDKLIYEVMSVLVMSSVH